MVSQSSIPIANYSVVLEAVKLRYAQKEMYAYSGIVLIAMNPFAEVDSLYQHRTVQMYAGKPRAGQKPHLFAIAEEAYADMSRNWKSQTIVVSGESGAGKTVSAKYTMRYLATRGLPEQSDTRDSNQEDAMAEPEKRISAIDSILEAFGNARTDRNDNSSRFGKYIQIKFDEQKNIVGAKIETYLLERSRLAFQPLGERNFHIFYQLVMGATGKERQDLNLLPVDKFKYLNHGIITIPGIDDGCEFQATRNALNTIGMSDGDISEMLGILAGVLHLGNVKIVASQVGQAGESSPNLVCEMLGLNPIEFGKWMVKRSLKTGGEKIICDLTQQQAEGVRDSIAKFIYSNLFGWLVNRINKSLVKDDAVERAPFFIGILDIYGFEHFTKNSFEQFCINYANEKLQQEFNKHVFKLEQEVYELEQIEWAGISFSDNEGCIDLIEGKVGILSLLDESTLRMGSDKEFVDKLNRNFDKVHHNLDKLHHNFDATTKHTFYKKPRFGNSSFTVCHYAADVTYESEGFIEKNRDTVPHEQMEVLRNSSNEFLQQILGTAASALEKSSTAVSSEAAISRLRVSSAVNRKPTLSGVFKSSLNQLMRTIHSTNVHYIRCIKPNAKKEAWEFDSSMVLSQLQACGILETLQLSAAGYPARQTYDEFAKRYYMLCHSTQWTSKIQDMCDTILRKVAEGVDRQSSELSKYQLGRKKIFLRAGILAVLEEKRTSRLHALATLIQKNLRCKYDRKRYVKTRASIVAIQAITRGFLTRRRTRVPYLHKAATTIQRAYRSWYQLRLWRQYRRRVIIVQTLWRQYRRRVIFIQTLWRRNWARWVRWAEKVLRNQVSLGTAIDRLRRKDEFPSTATRATNIDTGNEQPREEPLTEVTRLIHTLDVCLSAPDPIPIWTKWFPSDKIKFVTFEEWRERVLEKSDYCKPFPEKWEQLFPAYLINFIMCEMWRNGLCDKSEKFMVGVIRAIREAVKLRLWHGRGAVDSRVFWVANIHEMLAFTSLCERRYQRENASNQNVDEYGAMMDLLEKLKHDLKSLENHIFTSWIKKEAQVWMIQAIIDTPLLEEPSDSRPPSQGNSTSTNQLEKLRQFIDLICLTMKSFHLHNYFGEFMDYVDNTALNAILQEADISEFHGILKKQQDAMRKRGMRLPMSLDHIRSNCFCSQAAPGKTLQLIEQARKVLQLSKMDTTVASMRDICDEKLSTSQIIILLGQSNVHNRVGQQSVDQTNPACIDEPDKFSPFSSEELFLKYPPSWLQGLGLNYLAKAMRHRQRSSLSKDLNNAR